MLAVKLQPSYTVMYRHLLGSLCIVTILYFLLVVLLLLLLLILIVCVASTTTEFCYDIMMVHAAA